MSETAMRHIIATCGTLVVLLAWWGGYLSGGRGWWWTFIGLFIIYAAVYKLVDA